MPVPEARDAPDCSIDGCSRPASPKHGAMCRMHASRAERGGDMGAPAQERLAPWARVLVSAFDLADAESEDDAAYARSELRLRMAIVRWIRRNGWEKRAATRQLADAVAHTAARGAEPVHAKRRRAKG